MEVEVLRVLSWEPGQRDIHDEAMEVKVLKGLSWEGGRGNMQEVYAGGRVSKEVGRRKDKEERGGTSFEI